MKYDISSVSHSEINTTCRPETISRVLQDQKNAVSGSSLVCETSSTSKLSARMNYSRNTQVSPQSLVGEDRTLYDHVDRLCAKP